jgi:hypothetical protein
MDSHEKYTTILSLSTPTMDWKLDHSPIREGSFNLDLM